jgi:hypothetical protein
VYKVPYNPLTLSSLSAHLIVRNNTCAIPCIKVNLATRYAMYDPRIESGQGEFFRIRPDRPLGTPYFLNNGYRVSFRGVRGPECGVSRSLTSSAEVKERVELYTYSSSGSSWPVLGLTFPLTFYFLTETKKRTLVLYVGVSNSSSLEFSLVYNLSVAVLN